MTTGTADRPLTPAARRVLEVAERLFYERGIGSVGMELIAAEAGVTKKTVYDRYGCKEALIVAYLRTRDKRWRAFVNDSLAPIADPQSRILATYDALGDWLRRHSPRGCSMVNALAEIPDPDHTVHAVATGQKTWLRDLYADLAAQAGLPDPGRLADQFLLLHEGAIVTFSVANTPDAPEAARAAAAVLLSASTAEH
ncbi:TetR/AcrR family transcriptional regulator [Spirillospora sp. CA-294931]|uniref:TetR/AcrR family transcriptional regulator n=1 Tax=Spirillospora sp. CA-294931 TaxID=3240042 RepID=UPI003D947624